MERGIIYLMTTALPFLIKIDKISSENFEDYILELENDDFYNVSGLKLKFAIEVDDYDKKLDLLHKIFIQNKVDDAELFSLDINMVIQLLSAFEGRVLYPIEEGLNDKDKDKIVFELEDDEDEIEMSFEDKDISYRNGIKRKK